MIIYIQTNIVTLVQTPFKQMLSNTIPNLKGFEG